MLHATSDDMECGMWNVECGMWNVGRCIDMKSKD
jgi:hypothetical protein